MKVQPTLNMDVSPSLHFLCCWMLSKPRLLQLSYFLQHAYHPPFSFGREMKNEWGAAAGCLSKETVSLFSKRRSKTKCGVGEDGHQKFCTSLQAKINAFPLHVGRELLNVRWTW
ncbi:hypothetical protein VIGAN_10124700 [Vigna angularis var. angularis]|uniref:Uncharacterized protein n=1 Tax=Vigna angularis var. angularis TaxID=157739 RepID=A0A0S3T3D0_PHAAN|nr:hypothetical protein VIGAN_10124700 [Vigna angularis var. angularis]